MKGKTQLSLLCIYIRVRVYQRQAVYKFVQSIIVDSHMAGDTQLLTCSSGGGGHLLRRSEGSQGRRSISGPLRVGEGRKVGLHVHMLKHTF